MNTDKISILGLLAPITERKEADVLTLSSMLLM